MKKTLLACGLLATFFYMGCGPDNKPTGETATPAAPVFNFAVAEVPSFAGKLPDLQSFVFGTYDHYWIMFSGRRNGFHNFNPGYCDTCNANFPKNRANDSIFVYDTNGSGTLYRMSIPQYGGDTGNVFVSTNLPKTQNGQYLYACGGYGVANAADTFATKTYSYFMQINMPHFISAVIANNSSMVKQSIKWGKSPLVQNTGGELYYLPDNKFYMCVGHNFTGTYMSPTAQQIYLDKTNIFSIDTTGNTISLNAAGTITDGLPDSTTQFRRRDLVVAPAIQSNGTDVGISIYGGVFHYTSGSPESNNGTYFINPIYFNPGSNPQYRIDSSKQYANIYSTAFLCMYDTTGGNKMMMTTMFGGLGDNWTAIDSNANWTEKITTAMRSYVNGGDTTTYYQHTNALPAYIGAESVFIPAANLVYYNNNNYTIVDYSSLTEGQVVGYIYGGIVSESASDANGQTFASSKVYTVTFHKGVAGTN